MRSGWWWWCTVANHALRLVCVYLLSRGVAVVLTTLHCVDQNACRFQINRKISGSHVTDLDGSHTFTFCAYGEESGHSGKFEMYLALPYITNILEKVKDHDKDGTSHIARW